MVVLNKFFYYERKNPIKKIRSEKSTRKVNQKILAIQVRIFANQVRINSK